MKKHAIIPIFIPHRGCGHSCVFCDQRAITARQPDVTPSDVRGILDTWLSTMQRQDGSRSPGLETIEAAFYGGSFTGLPLEEQAAFLAVTKEYKDAGRIDKIHLSTRPDYIDAPVLEQLKQYGVDIIELGVQSFDPDVLALSRRGHSVADIYAACDLIRSYGFELGIQLMIGLPGDSYSKCMDSARRTVEIGPSLARLYPTVVLRNTELARMYESGTYQPLTTAEAVAITKDMYRLLDDAGITILRVGLKSTDLINDNHGDTDTVNDSTNDDSGSDSVVQAHSYHPAFRQLVEGELAKEDLEAQMLQLLATDASETTDDAPTEPRQPLQITFSCGGESFSNMIGHKSCNKKYFIEKYPLFSFRFTVDNTLPRGIYRVSL